LWFGAERHQTETALVTLDLEQRQHTAVDLDDACAILGGLPDLSRPLAEAASCYRDALPSESWFSEAAPSIAIACPLI
jgi:hypothetical protein